MSKIAANVIAQIQSDIFPQYIEGMLDGLLYFFEDNRIIINPFIDIFGAEVNPDYQYKTFKESCFMKIIEDYFCNSEIFVC